MEFGVNYKPIAGHAYISITGSIVICTYTADVLIGVCINKKLSYRYNRSWAKFRFKPYNNFNKNENNTAR